MKAEEVIIYFSGITETTLNEFLALPMPKLRVLSFGNHHLDPAQPTFILDAPNHQFLTHKLLKTIFNNAYLGELEELNLIGTNIDDNFLKFIKEMD
jgi:hypothetical protein